MVRRRRVRAIAWLTVIGILSGCTASGTSRSGPPSAAVIVTPAEAHAVVEGFWPKREAAVVKASIEELNDIESGTAALADKAVASDKRLRSPAPTPARIRRHGPIAVFVPRQTRYPATFLAEVNTTTYDGVSPRQMMMVFRRANTMDRWRLDHYAVWGLNDVDETGTGTNFDAPASAVSGIDIASLPAEVAEYWQTCWTTGHPPAKAQFVPGYWTTDRCERIAQSGPGRFDPACGCVPELRYKPYPNARTFAFVVRTRSVLACFAIEITDTSKPEQQSVLQQDTGRDNWGGLLPPGLYDEIVQTSIRQVCALADTSQPVNLIGDNDDDAFVRITGTPANRSPETVTLA